MAESVGPDAPALISNQLEHVIVLMRENRSFDHVMGAYGRAKPEDRWNPDPSAPRAPGDPIKQVKTFHETHYCSTSPSHHWSDVHLQWNNGGLDGFVAASNRGTTLSGGCAAMGYYNGDDVPLYYWLADNFAISDRYHSSILGPTMPNLTYYFYASSCGSVDNHESVATGGCPKEKTSIFELLERSGISHGIYSDSRFKSLGAAPRLTEVTALSVGSMSKFADDLANNTLPAVVFIEPNYNHDKTGIQNDDHPPANILDAQAFVHDVLARLMASSAWRHSIVFITWDEHGGYYDHVQPPLACEPDDLKPRDFAFDRLGFRTPFFAISPFAKKGYVSHHTSDHTSILRFIQAWKGLGALSRRDANAWPLLDMFDFSTTRDDIGAGAPNVTYVPPDPSKVASCANTDTATSCCVMDPPCAPEPL